MINDFNYFIDMYRNLLKICGRTSIADYGAQVVMKKRKSRGGWKRKR